MNTVDALWNQISKLGSIGYEELHIDSVRQVPIAGPKSGFFQEYSKEKAHKFALDFFRLHPEYVKSGFHTCLHIYIASQRTNSDAEELVQRFAAAKFDPVKIIQDAEKKATEIQALASSVVAEKYRDAQAEVVRLEAEAKTVFERSSKEAKDILANAAKLNAANERNLVLSRIRLEKIKEAAEPWKLTQKELLDTFIECSGNIFLSTSSYVIKQVKYFAGALRDCSSHEDADDLRLDFSLKTEDKELKYVVKVNAESSVLSLYLKYLENPSIIYDSLVCESETIVRLLGLAEMLQDELLIKRLKEFMVCTSDNKLLDEQDIDIEQIHYESLVGFVDLRVDYITLPAMEIILDQEVVPFECEAQLWLHFMAWVDVQAKREKSTIAELLVKYAHLLQKIHFNACSRKEMLYILANTHLCDATRSFILSMDAVAHPSRVYVKIHAGDATVRFKFTSIRNREYPLSSPYFAFGGGLIQLILHKSRGQDGKVWVGTSRNERCYFRKTTISFLNYTHTVTGKSSKSGVYVDRGLVEGLDELSIECLLAKD